MLIYTLLFIFEYLLKLFVFYFLYKVYFILEKKKCMKYMLQKYLYIWSLQFSAFIFILCIFKKGKRKRAIKYYFQTKATPMNKPFVSPDEKSGAAETFYFPKEIRNPPKPGILNPVWKINPSSDSLLLVEEDINHHLKYIRFPLIDMLNIAIDYMLEKRRAEMFLL